MNPALARMVRLSACAWALCACVPLSERTCPPGSQPFAHESLYFGTGKPNGSVSPAEWAEFLANVVTRRFPQGLTVLPASGQWRGADGAIVQEATYVLQLVYPDAAANEQAILEIISDYKQRFEQEAVMRVKAESCVSF